MELIDIILLIAIITFAILAVSLKDMLFAAVSLAAVSATLAIIFYRLNSPYAAAIEVSVCAGLITALFVTTISLTSRKWKMGRNILGIVLAVILTTSFVLMFVQSHSPQTQITITKSFSTALWKFCSLDVFLHLLIILAGTFSVLTLVKHRSK